MSGWTFVVIRHYLNKLKKKTESNYFLELHEGGYSFKTASGQHCQGKIMTLYFQPRIAHKQLDNIVSQNNILQKKKEIISPLANQLRLSD